MRRFAFLVPLLALVAAPQAFAQATPAPMDPTTSTLGGTTEGFSAFYGAPDQGSTSTSVNLWDCQGGGPDQLALQAANDHVTSIIRVMCGGANEDLNSLQTEAAGFFPPDVQFNAAKPVPGNNQEWTATSATLASELTPDQFHGCGGAAGTAGAFYLTQTGTGWRLSTSC